MSKTITKVLIYGKENCPYCERAKMLTTKIQEKAKIELEYHDFIKEELTKEELAKKVTAPTPTVQTVPQVKLYFSDGSEEYIGGFTEYYAYITDKTSLL